MAPYMAAGRIGLGPFLERYDRAIVRSFDNWVSHSIDPCDVYHCLSASGLRTHAAIRKRFGALTVCDRPCAHILYQESILHEEYDLQGWPFPGIDSHLKERELKEYESCDVIVVPSRFALSSFLEQGVPSSKLRKNPLGVDLTIFRRVPKEDDVFRVIYTGAISFQKGIPYLLRALCGLGLKNFEIWLIGYVRPEMKAVLARYEGQYRFLGTIDRSRLHWFYSQGSVFAFPSVHDGFGMVQAEAMACGLPVVATPNTGAPDLIKEGVSGFIVPIRDPDAIREKVLLLYRNPDLRKQMAEAAMLHVQQMGGWNDYGQRAAGIYEEAMTKRSTHRISTASCVG
jgi:glycosyltransferase involved in cell wall biosynthesis